MKYLKTTIFEFSILIITSLISVILYYFNIISSNTYKILNIIAFIITFFISGLYIAKKSNKKYYLEGLKLSGINILLFLILTFIFKYNFNIKNIIYYIILSFTVILGSISKNILKRK